jgi:hypothetical protein
MITFREDRDGAMGGYKRLYVKGQGKYLPAPLFFLGRTMTTWYWIAGTYCIVMWIVGPMIMLKGIKDLDEERG